MSGAALDAVTPAPGDGVGVAAVRAFLDGAHGVAAATLAATPQDPGFHAEGDVWTHTLQVLDALIALPAWQSLDAPGRTITFAAALLHDVGKPATTRTEPDGRISSRGHSARGDAIVRGWLWRVGVPFGVREHVCALVRHHQVPFFGITRAPADAARLATQLSLRLRHDWLALVAEADARGRRCAEPGDQARMIDHTALWLELCAELGVRDRPRGFASDHARVVHFEAEAARARPPDVAVHDDTSAEVIVMSGLPASGKDTWLRGPGAALPVVSLDALRDELAIDPADGQGAVIAAAKEAARVHLRAGQRLRVERHQPERAAARRRDRVAARLPGAGPRRLLRGGGRRAGRAQPAARRAGAGARDRRAGDALVGARARRGTRGHVRRRRRRRCPLAAAVARAAPAARVRAEADAGDRAVRIRIRRRASLAARASRYGRRR